MKKALNNFLNLHFPPQGGMLSNPLEKQTNQSNVNPTPLYIPSKITSQEKKILNKLKDLVKKHDDIEYNSYAGFWKINIDKSNFIDGRLCTIRLNDKIIHNNFSDEAKMELKSIVKIIEEKAILKKRTEYEVLLNNFLNI
jgi:hypothetical protein